MSQMLLDLGNGTVNGSLTNPTVAGVTTTGNGSIALDMHEGTGSTNVAMNVGDVTGTTPSLTVQIQESDDGSTGWASPAEGGLFTAVTAANKFQVIRFQRSKRYIRATYVVSGSASPTFSVSIVAYDQIKYSGTPSTGVSRSPSS